MAKDGTRANDGVFALKQLAGRMRPLRKHGPWPGRPPHPLPATIVGGGYELRSPPYDWRGDRRVPRALFQYTLSGAGSVTHHGTTYAATPGTAMLLWFPDQNRYWVPEGGNWEHFFVSCTGDEALAAYRQINARRGPVIPLAPDSEPVLLAATLCERFVGGQISSPYRSSAMAYALVMSLLEETARTAPTDPHRASIERAVEFARERIAEGVGVSDMARVAELSRHHFTRMFRRVHGVTPKRFLVDLRIVTATRLLRDPRRTVREVTRACGFADTSYFCRIFRQSVGVSPASYREHGLSG